MIIKYGRRALCMGDDVKNGIYKITMPEGSVISDLINVLTNGGNGNDWPIPQTSGDGWIIYSNIGKIATISDDKKSIEYYDADESALLSDCGIEWVFGERFGVDTDVFMIAKLFE